MIITSVDDPDSVTYKSQGISQNSTSDEVVTLERFESNSNSVLGMDATRLVVAILRKKYGLNLCETSGPRHFEIRNALDQLLGPYLILRR
jgi:hypothetical protein